MSGHSKWSTIKRKKGAIDAQRAKQFTKAIKEINIAIKEGGGPDPDANPSLRNAIANAKGLNMPKENIKRAIKKASGADADSYEEVTFEGYGPYGIGFFIECTTDNINRTVAKVREIFSKNEGSLGKNGSLEFLFDRKGVFTIERAQIKMALDELELELIEGGLEDMEADDEFVTVYSAFEDFGTLQRALENLQIEVKNTALKRIPLNTTALPIEQAKQILELEEKFEDEDDVQNVFHTLEVTEALLEALNEE